MGAYPKHREPYRVHSGYRTCTYCGKSFKARGIGTHIREKHKLVVKTIVNTKDIDLSTTQVNDSSTPVIHSKVDLSTVVITQGLSEVTGKDLSECKRPDGKHFYTDQDLWILISRISRVILQSDTSSVMSKWDAQQSCYDLIRDFEKRFECSFP
jgi:hypothetical protein